MATVCERYRGKERKREKHTEWEKEIGIKNMCGRGERERVRVREERKLGDIVRYGIQVTSTCPSAGQTACPGHTSSVDGALT